MTSLMKIKCKCRIWAKQSIERPLWELAVEVGYILFTSVRRIFRMGFFLSPTNFKRTKGPKESWNIRTARFPNSGALLLQWMIFQPHRSGGISQTFSPSSCSRILSAGTAFISRHFNSWYELGRQGFRQHGEYKAMPALWGSEVSIFRPGNSSVGKG